MRYFPKITGERVYLSSVNPEDAPLFAKWGNDPEVAITLGAYPQMRSLASERKTLEETGESWHDFAIVLKENDELLGGARLMGIDRINRRATLGLFIGEAERRGKGYGAEAIGLVLSYGFDVLNLNNVMLYVHSDNAQGIACYQKAGFKEIGRRREAIIRGELFLDDVCMDILAREYKEAL
ncbi:MAG: GNAT family N-acetyltransferase [Treponema sp.]|nr:GNAT family N-acetyltransferase [Treponema sp.]